MKPNVPIIVAERDFIGQTSPLSSTVIYTPSDDGLFRACVYLETSDTDTSHQAIAHLSWTDDVRAEVQSPTTKSQGFECTAGPADAWGQGTLIFRAKASTAISISITDGAGGVSTTPSPYSLFVRVEAL